MENMERPAVQVVTSDYWDWMSALVNSVAAYGDVVAVDDPLERITLELLGVRLGFVVAGGNGLVAPTVMLLSVNGHIVLAAETAGLWEVHPRVGERIAELFDRYGACPRCVVGEHGTCLGQHGQGGCRCGCGIDWAVRRIRLALGSPVLEPDRAVAELAGLAAAVPAGPLPRRIAAKRI